MNKINDAISITCWNTENALAAKEGTIYYDIKECRTIAFYYTLDKLATGETVSCKLYGSNISGTTNIALPDYTTTLTAGINANQILIDLSSAVAGDTVTINGIVFTAHATTTTVANREFSISGNAGPELEACIDDTTYGVPCVYATSSVDETRVKSTDGACGITISSDANILTYSLTSSAYIEVDVSKIDPDIISIKCDAEASATCNCSFVILRNRNRYTPDNSYSISNFG